MFIVRTLLTSTIAASSLLFGGAASAQAATPAASTTTRTDIVGPTWAPINTRTGLPRTGNPSLTLTAEGEFSGSDGCNVYWGYYTLDRAAGTATFDVQMVSLRWCSVAPTLDVDHEIEGTHNYYVYGDRLTLTSADGTRTVFTRK